MSDEHEFKVVVSGCTREQAEQVMNERINVDEDYGFDYQVNWYTMHPTYTKNEVADALRDANIHKARAAQPDDPTPQPCVVCKQTIKRVPGGSGPIWVHESDGFVIGSGTDTGEQA